MIQYRLLKILIVANAYICVQSLQCLKCENVISPILCNGKATCDSNEVCFIDKFKGFDEEILFNLGCRLNSKCSIQGGIDVCTNCCDSDLCNYGGCGETAPVNNHGPVCLSCKQSRNPAKCDSISICENGEVCHIEEINQSGIKFYTSGCLSEHLCRHFLTPTDIFGKRTVNITDRSSVVNCARCCHENLCNSNCPAAMSQFTTKEQRSFHTTSTIPSTTQTLSTFHTRDMTTTSVPQGDHKGTEFFLMFLKNFDLHEKSVKLIITTDHTALVNIYSPFPGVNKTVFVNQSVAHVDLPRHIVIMNTGLHSVGIHIISDKPISVVGFSNEYPKSCCFASAFNALPADKQGKYYKIQTLFRSYTYDSQKFGIVSMYPDTSLEITSMIQHPLTILGKNLSYQDSVTITLNQLQCYYYETYIDFDISGLQITSNKPFAVFSGNLVVGGHNVDSTVESIPPTNHWGKKFIVPLIHAAAIYLKIIVNDLRNVVNITGKNYFRSMTSSDKIQVGLPAGSYSVTAKQPIMLSVITKYVNISISPFMSIVPAITQFSNDYIVAGPSILSDRTNIPYRNFISIVIDQTYASGLKMNGNVLQALQETSITLENVKYKCMIVKLSGSSAHKISHVQTNVVFGAIIYGYGHEDAYGYPAGLRL